MNASSQANGATSAPDASPAAGPDARSTSDTTTTARPRVFSGVQPTGILHLGTYVGALRQWVEKQDERDSVFCVVDLHAITIPEAIDPQRLKDQVRSAAAVYFASGIDPERSVVFAQSHLHEHAELAWLLNCVTPLGWLYRMTQFKTKSEGKESVGTGLLDYPVLQAADILLYDTDLVPVGEDQVQHIELTRDIAVRFNHLFGDVFRLPKATVPQVGARLMGLDDPAVKMSKSIAAERGGHAINLLDDERTVRKAIMSAVTDSGREVRFEHASPGVRNLLTIFQALSGRPIPEIEAEYDGAGYGALKKGLVEVVLETLQPLQARYREYMEDRDALDRLLADGADRARAIARPVLARAKDAMGVG